MPASLDQLKKLSIFNDLTDIQLQLLGEVGDLISLGAGQTLIPFDAVGENLYGILEGRVQIQVKTKQDKMSPLRYLYEGEIVGEQSLFDQAKTAAAVVADCQLNCIKWNGSTLKKLLQANAELGRDVYYRLCRASMNRLNLSNRIFREAISEGELC